MPIKRFVTTFLLLAILTGSVTLVLSEISLERSQMALINSATPAADTSAVNSATSPKTAYVEGLPGTLPKTGNTVLANGDGNIDGQASPGPELTNSDNLTESYIQYFSSEVKRGNPDGPVPAADNGDPLVAVPDEARAAQMLAEVITQKPINFVAKPDEKSIKVIQSPTSEEGSNYIRSVGDILNQTLASPEFTRLLKQPNPDTQLITTGELVANKAFERTRVLAVPEPFLSFHRKLLSFLGTQVNLLAAASRHDDDPLRAILAIEQGSQLTATSAAELQAEVEKLKTVSYKTWPHNPLAAISRDLNGIPVAHAMLIVPVGDFFNLPMNTVTSVETTGSLWQKLLEYVLKTLVDTFINKLIDAFQNQVVAWIQGGGKPKFVTDWGGFLEDIADQATGETIRKIAPQFCRGFGPMVSFYFKKPPVLQLRTSCTLTQVVGNMERFANNFSNGGWLRYGEVMGSNNNFFSLMINTHDTLNEATAKKVDAETKKITANQGFKGVEVCTEYENQTVPTLTSSAACMCGQVNGTGPVLCTPAGCDPNNQGTMTTQQVCTHRETMTPGGAVAHSLFSSMDWKVERIIKAERIQALISAIIDSAINRTIKFGLANLTGSIKGGSGGTPNPNSTKTDQYGYKLETDYPALKEDTWIANSTAQTNAELNASSTTAQGKIDNASDAIQFESADVVLANLDEAQKSCTEWNGVLALTLEVLTKAASLDPTIGCNSSQAKEDTNDITAQNAKIQPQCGSVWQAATQIRELPGTPPPPSEVSRVLNEQRIGNTQILKSELSSAVIQLKGNKKSAAAYCPASSPGTP